MVDTGGLGQVRVLYYDDTDSKRSVNGQGIDKGRYVEVKLNPSRRRKRFDTVLIPWLRICKVIVY